MRRTVPAAQAPATAVKEAAAAAKEPAPAPASGKSFYVLVKRAPEIAEKRLLLPIIAEEQVRIVDKTGIGHQQRAHDELLVSARACARGVGRKSWRRLRSIRSW